MIKKTIASLLLTTTLAGGALLAYDSASGEKLFEQVRIAGDKIAAYELNEANLSSKLDSVIADAKLKITDANEKIQYKNGMMATYENTITDMRGIIQTLRAEKSALENELKESKTENTNLTNRINELEAELSEKQNEIDTLIAEKNSLQGDVDTLTKELETANYVIKYNADELEKINEAQPLNTEDVSNISTEIGSIVDVLENK